MTYSNGNSANTNNLKGILVSLLLILLLLNSFGFVIYHYSHSEQGAADQLWDYLSSDLFELFTISLLLPIILLVLETRFKFIQKILESVMQETEALPPNTLLIVSL